jgi:hypothetical protein
VYNCLKSSYNIWNETFNRVPNTTLEDRLVEIMQCEHRKGKIKWIDTQRNRLGSAYQNMHNGVPEEKQ